MKILTLLGCLIALSSCTSMPQTRDEFRKAIMDGAAFSSTSSHIVNRNFDSVTATLADKTKECLHFQTTQTRQQGYVVSSTTIEYQSSFRVVNRTTAELTIQHIPRFARIGPSMPEGGFYWMAVDVQRLDNNTTKLNFYGPSGETKIYDAIKGWSNGTAVACPFS